MSRIGEVVVRYMLFPALNSTEIRVLALNAATPMGQLVLVWYREGSGPRLHVIVFPPTPTVPISHLDGPSKSPQAPPDDLRVSISTLPRSSYLQVINMFFLRQDPLGFAVSGGVVLRQQGSQLDAIDIGQYP